MKPLPLVALCVALSLAASLAAQHLSARRTPAPPASATPAVPSGAVSADLIRFEDALERQQRDLEDLRREFLARLEGLARQPVAAVPADAPTGPPVEDPAEVPAGSADPRTAEEWLAQLLSPELVGLEREELWNAIARAGRTRELVALFEARAARDPNDPNLQVELGGAYLRMVQEVAGGPLAGHWADRADSAFDRALELEPAHVQARLSKAVALSFWPPIFGKQADAVKQFETLIGQLDGQPLQPSHAQAWLLLGNLHQQQGQHDKALEIWQKGAGLFPSDPAFADKLGQ